MSYDPKQDPGPVPIQPPLDWTHRAVDPVFLPDHPIRVLPGRLEGTITPPPSKSVAHRAMICAALSGHADWPHRLSGITGHLSDDLKATARGLELLLAPDLRKPVIDCGESGSTVRFLVPLALALGKHATFIGTGALPERPLRDFNDILSGRPVDLRFPADPGLSLPLHVSGRINGGVYYVPGDTSSQYMSGLLMALGATGDAAEVELTSPLRSAPYVYLTMEVMKDFGVEVEYDPHLGPFGGFKLEGGQTYRVPADGYTVEADYSQAAFWLVAAFIGHPLQVTGLSPNSAQGDRVVLDVLERLATIRERRSGNLDIDVRDIPDLVPILSIAAATVAGVHQFRGCERLRVKECDRLDATMELLQSMQVDSRYDSVKDVLSVYGIGLYDVLQGHRPGPDPRPPVSCYNDHRMAMTAAIAGTCSRYGTVIDKPACVAKSWPDFFLDFARLGGVFMAEEEFRAINNKG